MMNDSHNQSLEAHVALLESRVATISSCLDRYPLSEMGRRIGLLTQVMHGMAGTLRQLVAKHRDASMMGGTVHPRRRAASRP
ncbi:hypothetical protein [Gluconacetobacter diazotrophicus]|uniref:Uncharacterized protein n=1 Tax=Gluconacetobacter diazotrophicus (strain ATCC 49037 / DSM 5601 / CCUG 37298 / CIP 103539 / LMG 7603 / PAl5) TaxID=272568 RepID=A9HDV8_GLUDA|nr:hypothetical protein [Gluconacetobacter diazotrophicus]CAP55150.1 hypothetical protein GDI1207 [Gluconacetobacter diazotrophicus PA1 5]